MTLLSLINTYVMRRFGVVISHDVEDTTPNIHPLRLWTGKHVPGTWRLVDWPLVRDGRGRWVRS